jgi:hypothetical protein
MDGVEGIGGGEKRVVVDPGQNTGWIIVTRYVKFQPVRLQSV